MEKPVLIYDGECSFCRYWAGRLKYRVGDEVEIAPSQAVRDRFPDLSEADFARALQYVGAQGDVSSGAEAAVRCLSQGPGRAWPLWCYRNVPGIAPASEWAYGLVADHRRWWGLVNRCLWGKSFEPSRFFIARWLFLRNLGTIFLVAFWSLLVQIDGLVGSKGILPVEAFLEGTKSLYGFERFWHFPTLFWLNHSDIALQFACAAGIGVSVLITIGVFVPLMTFIAWMLYLSLVTVGQSFLGFQGDALLLETAFLAIFLAPFQFRPQGETELAPSRLVLFLFWCLLFRLTFSAGLAKLGDEPWRAFSALSHHFETQPLPTRLGWYAHHLPVLFQQTAVLLTFAIELAVPFLLFLPRRIRHFAGLSIILLQLFIIATGNYGFFNWLAIALCLLLFDDQSCRRVLPRGIVALVGMPERPKRRPRRHAAVTVPLSVCLLVLGGTVLSLRFAPETRIPEAAHAVYRASRPFFIVNGYGQSPQIAAFRAEIVVEGSYDGVTWKPYEFKWKPGDLERPPLQATPHQPRLDWLMCFAASDAGPAPGWYSNFMTCLFRGTPEVLELLDENPFEEMPPQYLRGELYAYRFTGAATLREEDRWWRREYLGRYFGPIAAPIPGPAFAPDAPNSQQLKAGAMMALKRVVPDAADSRTRSGGVHGMNEDPVL